MNGTGGGGMRANEGWDRKLMGIRVTHRTVVFKRYGQGCDKVEYSG